MGRRSRKRDTAPAAAPTAPPRAAGNTPHAAPRSHRAPMTEAPKAPWSPFPLVELCVLIAIVLIVLGFVTDGSRRGALLACGIALASLAGLELAIREHFAGFRSHSALLAGAAAVIVDVPLYFLTGLPQLALLAVGVVIYTLGFVALRRAFQARTGGIGFRV
jgi:predicted membrane channel-forming protein YqfA (hemolysin III family)